MIKLFIFDLEGVLIPVVKTALCQKITEFADISVKDFKKIYADLVPFANIGEISLKQLYENIIAKLNLKNKDSEKLLDIHVSVLSTILENKDEIVLNMIDQLKDRWEVVCLINTEIETENLFREKKIIDIFHASYLSTREKMRKPQPEFFKLVLDDQKVQPHEAVYIDNKIENVIAANDLRINGIHYDSISSLVKTIYELIKEELE